MAASSFGIGVPLAHFIETSRGHGAEAMTTHFLRGGPAQRAALTSLHGYQGAALRAAKKMGARHQARRRCGVCRGARSTRSVVRQKGLAFCAVSARSDSRLGYLDDFLIVPSVSG